ncbi:uncharacterized protein ELE39_000751 [Cryptosporidium sp. chipmunk genotype I]|uniref:uncharacterized protein n=1 Tax=Cryptosporidium sp. chipmunk genotype I TaxID=1280935 RepID=UPI00351A0DDB|nr:hypothetical protein ELE39_000751 [Cryptosporidium sp. chipmunk genotype I]
MTSETVSIEIEKSAIINSEAIGHKISSLEDKYYNIRRYHESRLKDLNLEIKELSNLISKEQNDIQEMRSIKERQLREVELRISNQIMELREKRSESDTLIEGKIKDHIHRMETLEFSKSSEIDIRREDQFEKISRSLNDLTQKVECLRKRRFELELLILFSKTSHLPISNASSYRKSILTSLKKELANGYGGKRGLIPLFHLNTIYFLFRLFEKFNYSSFPSFSKTIESENITKSIQKESIRRENSVQSMKQ